MKLRVYPFLTFVSTLCAAVSLNNDFDHLRFSVVKVQAISAEFDWLRPFAQGEDDISQGSGFVVQAEPYPLFVTNEHVIDDATNIVIQVPALGDVLWTVHVVSICWKFDLALLAFKEPAAFNAHLLLKGVTLRPLPLLEGAASMGDDVVAAGFPLGVDDIKISMGVVAGNQDVDDNVCIQSTAPIALGSGGGPLLDADATVVIGVNFATATEGENIIYVVPAWRVHQLVRKHLQDQPGVPKAGAWRRIRVDVPEHELTTSYSNKALQTMVGCDHGIYVSRIGGRSFFQHASPPMVEGSFLVSVRGLELDNFGTGFDPHYAADRVAFPDLFFMTPDISSDMDFETCSQGVVTRHTVSLAWRSEYDEGINLVTEPRMRDYDEAFEVFGDLGVMQMTENHIDEVVYGWRQDMGPSRWLHPDSVTEPRLVVNFLRAGSYAGKVLSTGASVKFLNGKRVRTLKEWRTHLAPAGESDIWTMETDMGLTLALMFRKTLEDQLWRADVLDEEHLLTEGTRREAERVGLREPKASDSKVALEALPGRGSGRMESAGLARVESPLRAATGKIRRRKARGANAADI